MRWSASLLLLVGCNVVYGLDETRLRPPDLDDDGLEDDIDNCPTVRNADQADEDGDGFGDACDGCLGLATATNHDEDLDFRGDSCDLCPTVADFGEDEDRDGVGDRCEQQPGANELVHFDPFAALSPSWQSRGVPWQLVDDSIAPRDVTPLDDPGIVNAELTIDGTWYAEVGILSTHPWQAGERFGLALVDANGAELVSCDIECGPACEVIVRGGSTVVRGPTLALPAGTIRLVKTASDTLICVAMGAVVNATRPGGIPSAGAFAIHGTPAMRVRHFAVWRHTRL